MPNHVQNILVITGHEMHLKPFLNHVKGKKDFDFDTIIPMPKELMGTCSPTKIVSKRDYDKHQRKPDISGFSVGKPITKEMSKDFIHRFGYDNWYDWKIAHWGTKWGAYEVTIDDIEDAEGKNQKSVTIHFQTAWSSGSVVIQNLSDQFPTLEFFLTYADEDCGYNVGKYWFKEGNIKKEYIPEGGSNEAMEIYFECNDPDKEGWEMKDGKWEYTAEW